MVKKLMYKGQEIPGYYIFDNGRVWTAKAKRHKFLKDHIETSGYHSVHIVFPNGKATRIGVHILLAYTFLGLPPKTMKDPTVDHIDNNKDFNNVINLQWLERSENSRKIANLSQYQRFTRKDVQNMCIDLTHGLSDEEVMKKYKINKSYICNLKAGRIQSDISTKYFPSFPTERKKYANIKDKIHDICADLASGLYTRREIASMYDMTYLSVQNILRRKTYTEISCLYDIDNVRQDKVGRPKS